MKITLVISTLSSGGAERVMSIIANYWAERGHEITLITIDSENSDFYSLDKRIHRIALGLKEDSPTKWSAIAKNAKRLKRLREEIKRTKPDVVISFIDRLNVLTLIATRGLSVPIVVSEHIDPRQLPPLGVWKPLRRLSYLWASSVVVLTAELKEVVSQFVSPKKIYVVPNPAIIDTSEPNTVMSLKVPSPYIVAMGRLNKQKGFDLLLNAFSLCKNKNLSLVILGEGSERDNLETMIEKMGIKDRVLLPGRVLQPKDILSKAEIFVLSSRFEGFPMALVEAMSCGLPVISFNCPTGPSDIIRDGVDGLLLPAGNVEALAKAIDSLSTNENEKQRLASRAIEVTDRFSLESVMKKWEEILNKISA